MHSILGAIKLTGQRAAFRITLHTPTIMMSVLDLDENSLSQHLTELGEPAYRARQIRAHILRHGVLDYGGMTDLPIALRDGLRTELPTTPLTLHQSSPTPDGQTFK